LKILYCLFSKVKAIFYTYRELNSVLLEKTFSLPLIKWQETLSTKEAVYA